MSVLLARAAETLEKSRRTSGKTAALLAASKEQQALREIWQMSCELRLRIELMAFVRGERDEGVQQALAVADAVRADSLEMLRKLGGGYSLVASAALGIGFNSDDRGIGAAVVGAAV